VRRGTFVCAWTLAAAAFVLALQPGQAVSAPARYQQPILLTSSGQSEDIQEVKLLAERLRLNFKFSPQATADELRGVQTLLIVVGASLKGLGAAGVNLDQEVRRTEALLSAAKAARIRVVGLHISGAEGRNAVADRLINVVGPKTDYLIVEEEGNKDGLFTRIAEGNKIPISFVNSILMVRDLLKEMFGV
jgi:hypothetical protein